MDHTALHNDTHNKYERKGPKKESIQWRSGEERRRRLVTYTMQRRQALRGEDSHVFSCTSTTIITTISTHHRSERRGREVRSRTSRQDGILEASGSWEPQGRNPESL